MANETLSLADVAEVLPTTAPTSGLQFSDVVEVLPETAPTPGLQLSDVVEALPGDAPKETTLDEFRTKSDTDLESDTDFSPVIFGAQNRDALLKDPVSFEKLSRLYKTKETKGTTIGQKLKAAFFGIPAVVSAIGSGIAEGIEKAADLNPIAVTARIAGAASMGDIKSEIKKIVGEEAEVLASVETAGIGTTDLLRRSARSVKEGVGKILPGVSSKAELSGEEWKERLRRDVAGLEQTESIGRGSGEVMKALGADAGELAKIGITVDPETISELSVVTDPVNFITLGGAAVGVVAKSAGKLGTRVLATATTAEQAAKLAKTLNSARDVASLGRTLAGKVTGATVSMIGKGVEKTGAVTEKVARSLGGTGGAIGLGAILGHDVYSALGGGLVARAGPRIIQSTGRGIQTAGEVLSGARPVPAALSVAGDVGKEFAKGAAESAVLILPFELGARPDEEQHLLGLVGLGGLARAGVTQVPRAARAASRAAQDKLAESIFKETELAEAPPSATYGTDPNLDTIHETTAAKLDPRSQKLLNWTRERFRDSGVEIYALDDAAFARKAGTGDAYGFSMDMGERVDNAGNATPILQIFLNGNTDALPHELFHALSELDPAAAKQLSDSVVKSWTPEQKAYFTELYNTLRNGGLPKEQWKHVLDDAGVAEEAGAEVFSRLYLGQDLSGVSPDITKPAALLLSSVLEKLGAPLGRVGVKPGTPGVSTLGIRPGVEATKVGQQWLSNISDRLLKRGTLLSETPIKSKLLSDATPADITKVTAGAPVTPIPPTVRAPTPKPEIPPVTNARNIRVTKQQQNDFAAKRAAETGIETVRPAASKLAPDAQQHFKTISEAMETGSPVVEIEHQGIKTGEEVLGRTQRRAEQEAAYLAEGAAATPTEIREAYQKTFVPVRWETAKGKPQLLAMSLDKVLANVHRVVKDSAAKGVETKLPYEIVDGKLTDNGWGQVVDDLQSYAANQANGYRGDGNKFVRPKEDIGVSIPAENPAYNPARISAERMNFMNLVQGLNPPLTARVTKGTPGNIKAQLLSELQGRTPEKPTVIRPEDITKQEFKGTGRSVMETNPLRNELAAAGVPVRELIEVTERINAEDITKSASRSDINFQAPVTDIIRAGFLPGKETMDAGYRSVLEGMNLSRDDKGPFFDMANRMNRGMTSGEYLSLDVVDQTAVKSILRGLEIQTGTVSPVPTKGIPAWGVQLPPLTKGQKSAGLTGHVLEEFESSRGDFSNPELVRDFVHEISMDRYKKYGGSEGITAIAKVISNGEDLNKMYTGKSTPRVSADEWQVVQALIKRWWQGKHPEDFIPMSEVMSGIRGSLQTKFGGQIADKVMETAGKEFIDREGKFLPGKETMDAVRAGLLPDLKPSLPTPSKEIRDLATQYTKAAGIEYQPARNFSSVNPDLAKRLADFYDSAKSDPSDPTVAASYQALVDETLAQYKTITDAGYVIESFPGQGEPYKSSADAVSDIRDNKHLFFLKTDPSAFESGNIMVSDTGNGFLVNDVFRAVHDFFGHGKEGYQFGPRGEFNAWRAHSELFTPAAQGALAAETLAQNSWVNFGKHLRDPQGNIPQKGQPGYVAFTERPFATQKAVVIPENLIQESITAAKSEPKFLPDNKSIDEFGKEILLLSPDDWRKATESWDGGLTAQAYRLGLDATDRQYVETLKSLRDEALEKIKSEVAKGDLDAAMTFATKSQLFAEAYQAATGAGQVRTQMQRLGMDESKIPFPDYEKKFLPKTDAGKALSEEGITFEKLDNGVDNFILVANAEGKRIGEMAYSLENSKLANLSALFVEPEFRKRGIGEALLREVGADLQGRGVERVIAEPLNQVSFNLIKKLFGEFDFLGDDVQKFSTAEARKRLPETLPKVDFEIPRKGKVETGQRLDPDAKFLPAASMPEGVDAIDTAAIRTPSGRVFTGTWHGDALMKFVEAASEGLIDERPPAGVKTLSDMLEGEIPEGFIEDGFVTKSGKFLNRAEALDHAEKIGQLKENAPPGRGSFQESGILESNEFKDKRQFLPGKQTLREISEQGGYTTPKEKFLPGKRDDFNRAPEKKDAQGRPLTAEGLVDYEKLYKDLTAERAVQSTKRDKALEVKVAKGKYKMPDKVVSAGKRTGWILPNKEFVPLDAAYHEQFLADNSKELNSKFGTEFEDKPDVFKRLGALNKGFVRVRYIPQEGGLHIEANVSRFPQLKSEIIKQIEGGADDIDRLLISLLNDTGNTVDSVSVKVAELEGPERLDALLEAVNELRTRGGKFLPGRIPKDLASEPGYIYHATNLERLFDIAREGKLKTFRPHDFTEQSTWPDGATEKRAYFSRTANVIQSFAPAEGASVALRVSENRESFKRESTGDIYTRKPIPVSQIEYLDDSGEWKPLNKLTPSVPGDKFLPAIGLDLPIEPRDIMPMKDFLPKGQLEPGVYAVYANLGVEPIDIRLPDGGTVNQLVRKFKAETGKKMSKYMEKSLHFTGPEPLTAPAPE